jgi:hypothetical protein
MAIIDCQRAKEGLVKDSPEGNKGKKKKAIINSRITRSSIRHEM